MIRVFELFCKSNFKNITAMDLFLQFMATFKPNDHPCPKCGVKHPDWKQHAVYNRYLISFENGCIVSYLITIIRYRCLSCKSTHAILPESIIPYQPYSFLFIIAVMKDYYTRSLTVEGICSKYDISKSTLYSWTRLYRTHKKIWLGLLEDACTSTIQFLEGLFSGTRLYSLHEFFHTAGFSFLQGRRTKTAQSAPG